MACPHLSQRQSAFDIGKDGSRQIYGMALSRKALQAGGIGARIAHSPRRSSGKLGRKLPPSAVPLPDQPTLPDFLDNRRIGGPIIHAGSYY
jgi:hypothetical protein